MENQILSHASEQLIPTLSYTLGPTAQFVSSRQATTFFLGEPTCVEKKVCVEKRLSGGHLAAPCGSVNGADALRWICKVSGNP